MGSIPSRRKDFVYIIAVYKRDAAERIMQRVPTPGEEEVDMKVKETLAIAGISRAHVVEGVVDTVERKAWGDADSDMGGQDGPHEYTLVILGHSVDSIKKLKYKHLDLNHWDSPPPSNGEIEIEAEIYDP
eukprot:1800972-Prymnesium_polylepis.1